MTQRPFRNARAATCCALSTIAVLLTTIEGAVADSTPSRSTQRCDLQANAGVRTLQLTAGDPLETSAPALAFNSAKGEFGVTWGEFTDGSPQIMMTLVDTLADQSSTPTLVVQTDDYDPLQSSIAYNPVTNRYFVTWRSFPFQLPPAPNFNHLFGRLVNDAGLPDGPHQHLSLGGMESSVIFNSATENFLAVGRCFFGGPSGVYSRRIDGLGNPQDSPVQLDLPDSGELPGSAPAGRSAFNSTTGEYLTTWRDQDNSRLMGRLLNPQGQPAGSSTVLSSIMPGTHLTTGAAYDPINNRYLVVFNEFNGGDGGTIFGQFVADDGTATGSPIAIQTAVSMEPDIAYDPVNKVFLVVWRHADYYSISAQLVSLDGDLLNDPVILSEGMLFEGGTYTGGIEPSVAANTVAGGFMVSWRCFASLIPFQPDAMVRAVALTCEGTADLDGDGVVDVSDLLILLAAWGQCDGSCVADLNGDDVVDVSDLLELLAAWG